MLVGRSDMFERVVINKQVKSILGTINQLRGMPPKWFQQCQTELDAPRQNGMWTSVPVMDL